MKKEFSPRNSRHWHSPLQEHWYSPFQKQLMLCAAHSEQHDLLLHKPGYDATWSKYDADMNLGVEIRKLLQQHPHNDKLVCIDAGCGTGRAACQCQKLYPIRAVGVNFTKLQPSKPVKMDVIEGLIEDLPQILRTKLIPEAVLIVAHNSLHYSATAGTLAAVLEAFYLSLLPGGKVIIYQNREEIGVRAPAFRAELYQQVEQAINNCHIHFAVTKVCNPNTGIMMLHLVKQC